MRWRREGSPKLTALVAMPPGAMAQAVPHARFGDSGVG
jgi:hypothetical protein